MHILGYLYHTISVCKALAPGHFWLLIRGHNAITAAGSFVPWDWVIIFITFLSQKLILQINTDKYNSEVLTY